MEACFIAYDKNSDGRLDLAEFRLLTNALFKNDEGCSYALDKNKLKKIFEVFDKNNDGYIDKNEFAFCWNHWIKIIVKPISALIIVDVQNDFITGSLSISNCEAKQNGYDVIKPINQLLDSVKFTSVFYSFDWHPDNHISFAENVQRRRLDSSSSVSAEDARAFDTVIFAGPPPLELKLWPKHCVQGTWGSELHKDLRVMDKAINVYKGSNPENDSFSAFWDNVGVKQTNLNDQLRMNNVTDVYVCGICYDVCVKATATDALAFGYRTILLDDCCRGIDLENIEITKNIFLLSNGVIVNSNQVKAMVDGNDRRPELGYKLAMELKANRSNISISSKIDPSVSYDRWFKQ